MPSFIQIWYERVAVVSCFCGAMAINFSNLNTIWASILAETLHRLGLTTAVICPGSRSAPLAIAFAQHPQIEAIPVLDERSAAFFALGLARRTGQPVVLVCTSGTAGANFYPALIEAHQSCIPLFVLTADRPPELRDCNAGQTIDQQKLYGSFPNYYQELSLPSLEGDRLSYLRQSLIHAWEKTRYPVSGFVHLNLPFRDPLAPIPDPQLDTQAFAETFDSEGFFRTIRARSASLKLNKSPELAELVNAQAEGRYLIIAGIASPLDPQAYCEAIAQLSQRFRAPILAEGISPLRNYLALNPHLISTYDFILRHPDAAIDLRADTIIRIGETPTSKALRQWLMQTQPKQWLITEGDRNLDPLHLRTTHLHTTLDQIVEDLASITIPTLDEAYLEQWQQVERKMRRSLDTAIHQSPGFFEGKVPWLLSQYLPTGTPLLIANSTTVRNVEWYWQPGNSAVRPFCNRGANGIDGTLSTALGTAYRHQSSVLLTGDLALLHDTNGFLLTNKFVGHLTIIVINNNGGGIFEYLPIARFNPPFEEFFATPQYIDFAKLCETYGVEYELIQDWDQFIHLVQDLPEVGIRLLEVRCDRKSDVKWQRDFLTASML
jgi:2-succinyl-5-enolpyruvyl-6-hydroxy-3-cyclohexene-1-carboxylate synthase